MKSLRNLLEGVKSGARGKSKTPTSNLQRSEELLPQSENQAENEQYLKPSTSTPDLTLRDRETDSIFEAEGTGPVNDSFKSEEEHLRAIWNELGVGKSGYLTRSELAKVCKHIGMKDMTSQDVSALFDNLDTDADGNVSFDEFLYGLFTHSPNATMSRSNSRNGRRSRMRSTGTPSFLVGQNAHLFSSIDKDGTGYADGVDLIDYWDSLGLSNGADVLKHLEFDPNGKVNLKELNQLLDQELTAPELTDAIIQAGIISYQNELRFARNQIDNLLAEREKLRNDLQAANSRSAIMAQEGDERHMTLDKMRSKELAGTERRYQEQIRLLQSELDQERTNWQNQLGKQRKNMETTILQMKEEHSKMKESANAMQKEVARLESDLLDAQERLAESEKLNIRQQRELDAVADLHRKLAEMEDENEDITFSEVDFTSLKKRAFDLKSENHRLVDRIDELEYQVIRLGGTELSTSERRVIVPEAKITDRRSSKSKVIFLKRDNLPIDDADAESIDADSEMTLTDASVDEGENLQIVTDLMKNESNKISMEEFNNLTAKHQRELESLHAQHNKYIEDLRHQHDEEIKQMKLDCEIELRDNHQEELDALKDRYEEEIACMKDDMHSEKESALAALFAEKEYLERTVNDHAKSIQTYQQNLSHATQELEHFKQKYQEHELSCLPYINRELRHAETQIQYEQREIASLHEDLSKQLAESQIFINFRKALIYLVETGPPKFTTKFNNSEFELLVKHLPSQIQRPLGKLCQQRQEEMKQERSHTHEHKDMHVSAKEEFDKVEATLWNFLDVLDDDSTLTELKAQLEEEMERSKTLAMELDDTRSRLSDKAKKAEEALIERSTRESQAFEKELDVKRKKMVTLEDELQEKDRIITDLKSTNERISGTLNDQERSLELKMRELDQRREEVEHLRAEKGRMQHERRLEEAKLNERLKELYAENLTLKRNKEEFSKEKLNYEQNLARLKEQKECATREIVLLKESNESWALSVDRLERLVTDRDRKLEHCEGELQRIKTELNKYCLTCEDLTAQNTILQSDKDRLGHQLMDARAMIEHIEKDKFGVESQLTLYKDETHREIDDLKKTNARLLSNIEQHTRNLESRSTENEAKLHEVSSLRQQLDHVKLEFERLENNHKRAITDLERERASAEKHKVAVESLEATNRDLERRLKELENQFSMKCRDVDTNHSELNRVQEEKLEFEKSCSKLKEALNDKDDELHSLKRERDRLNEELQERMMKTEQEIDRRQKSDQSLEESKADNAKLLKELGNLKDQLQEIQQESQLKSKSLEELKNQLDQAIKEQRLATGELQDKNTEIDQLKDTNSRLNDAVNEALQRFENGSANSGAEGIKTHVSKRNLQLERDMSDLRQKSDAIKRKSDRAQITINELERDNATLTTRLREVERERDSFQDRMRNVISDSKKESSNFERDRRALQQFSQSLEENLGSLKRERDEIKRQKDIIETENVQLKQKLKVAASSRPPPPQEHHPTMSSLSGDVRDKQKVELLNKLAEAEHKIRQLEAELQITRTNTTLPTTVDSNKILNNNQNAQQRLLNQKQDELDEVYQKLQHTKKLLEENQARWKKQLEKSTQSDKLVKELYIENSELVQALRVAEEKFIKSEERYKALLKRVA